MDATAKHIVAPEVATAWNTFRGEKLATSTVEHPASRGSSMDVVMPKVNGIEALKGIKNVDPNAKVVMCTAVGQEQMVKLAIKTGAKGYIVKPFQAPKVLEEIKNVLGA